MKTRSLKLLMVAILIMQTITFTSVFASENNRFSVDFSNVSFTSSGSIRTPSSTISGNKDYQIVKGQYGKAPDDASFRMYSISSTSDMYFYIYPTLDASVSGEYIHVSFQYLVENVYSSLTVDWTPILSDGTKETNKVILLHPMTSAQPKSSRFFTDGYSSRPGTKLDHTPTIGTWNQVDLYLSRDNTNATMFLNEKKIDFTLPEQYIKTPVKDIESFRFRFKTTKNTNFAGAQIDNVIVEKVTSIPSSQNYTYLGEKLDFDDNMSIRSNDGQYRLAGNNYETDRFSTAIASAYPAVKFTNPVNLTNKVETGVFGRPSWDHSIHATIPVTLGAMYYNTGVNDLKDGEYGHLTFAIANNKANAGAGLVSDKAIFSDAIADKVNLFEMSAMDGKFKFFDQDTGAKWEVEKWYKVDMIFKNANGTKVDCYIDGVKCIADYVWNAEKPMNFVGTLNFTDVSGADYYFDDVAFGRFNEASLNNLTAGYEIISADNVETYIDNEEKLVAITSDATIPEYAQLLSNKDNLVFYNQNGAIVYKGKLSSATWIKATNGFGAGTYYNVGYKTDKLAIGDITYDADAKELKSQAEVGLAIKEDFSAEDAPIQATGTVIIALYDGNELVGCMPYSYTGLAEDAAKEVVLPNVESVAGKTVKVFIFNSETDITPLVVNKVKTFN